MNASLIALSGSPLTMRWLAVLATLLLTVGAVQAQTPAPEPTLRLLTAGAFKEVVLALLPAFQTQTGLRKVCKTRPAGPPPAELSIS
jgi:ABC-type molybdate transport system substrate-binding protein